MPCSLWLRVKPSCFVEVYISTQHMHQRYRFHDVARTNYADNFKADDKYKIATGFATNFRMWAN